MTAGTPRKKSSTAMGPHNNATNSVSANKEGGFPLLYLGRPGGIVNMTCTRKLWKASDLVKMSHVIIYGERGHRFDEFFDWYKQNLSYRPITEIRLYQRSINKNSLLLADLSSLEWIDQPNRLYEVLERHSNESQQLILRKLTMLDKSKTLDLAKVLSHFADEYPESQLHVLNTSSSHTLFSDTPENSGYARFAHQFRLANLSGEELREAWKAKGYLDDEVNLASEVLKLILEHTGGQPLLVDHLGQYLQQMRGDKQSIELEDVEEAMRRMRSSPPGGCTAWQEHLRQSLQMHKELHYSMKSYVKQKTLASFRFPPPANELELFVGGWLGLDADGCWGITSRFHAYLASQVLNV